MKTIAFSSIKGGTGKSSLCILTANYAAAAGYRVLVADLDIQNSATSYYLDSPDEADRPKNIASVFHTERMAENTIPTNHSGIDLLASSLDLVKFRPSATARFGECSASSALPYDFFLHRYSPNLRHIVLNALNAARPHHHAVAFSQFDYKGALFYEAPAPARVRQAPSLAHPLQLPPPAQNGESRCSPQPVRGALPRCL
jgi:chromosome partitioning protein